ncbi:MAG: HEAT repeat domain-containing protein [Planctomycetes bacterium]|nr:HEAT repeat domain-containing protein [Planctomycetota bacterium]
MARSFPQFLLAAAVAAVVGGSVRAQDTPLQEAVTLLRLSKSDEAVAKLREILASDPSNTEALKLYQSVSQDEWYMLMTTRGEVQQIAQSILERARVETRQRSRDEAAIAELVATATAKDSDYGTRQAAINKLVANHGEFAVPALVQKLGDPDDAEGQIQAIYVLSQLRSAAVLPLIEALRSSNELVAQNAAAALHQIGDDRAVPAMVYLAGDERPNVSAIARKFVAKKGVSGGAVDLLLAQARNYLQGEIPIGGHSDVVWQLVDDRLVATDVPALLYPSELAKSVAASAVRIAPSSLEARSMLAQANLGQANLIETSLARGDEALRPLEPVAAELKIAALATGVDALRSALDAGVRQGMAPVAIGAIQALAAAESVDTIDQSTLLAALQSSDKRIQYAAAESLVVASGGARVPQQERVVAVLADAVGEEAVRTIHVIAPSLDSAAAVQASSGVRGMAVEANANAIGGMRSLLVNPNVDVVVINEILPDRMPEDVIGNIKKDPRLANTRIVVIAKDVEAAQARFGDGVGVVQAPLTGETLVAAVNTALEGVSSPAGERAEAYATKASNALLAIARQKGSIAGALGNLAKQLDRGDAVSVPAARALGLAGGPVELSSLAVALGNGGSVERRTAVAEAMGNILARIDACPQDAIQALVAVVDSDAEVGLRTAAAVALGKSKLEAQWRADIQKKLRRVAGHAGGGEG